MKKELSALILALVASTATANAADLTANTTMTATVREGTAFEATYNELAQLTGEPNEQVKFGRIDFSGYKKFETAVRDISIKDATGQQGYLTFSSGNNSFTAIATLVTGSASYPIEANTPGTLGNMINTDSSSIELTSQWGNKTIAGGKYSDIITLEIANQ